MRFELYYSYNVILENCLCQFGKEVTSVVVGIHDEFSLNLNASFKITYHANYY